MKLSCLLLMLLLSIYIFGQQTTPVLNTDYLQKSKRQKTTAWILLCGGAGLCIIGGMVSVSAVQEDPFGSAFGANSKFNSGGMVSVTGGLAILGSIPLFIAASKNKHRAMSLSIKNESALQIVKSSMAYQFVPSLTFKLRL